MRFLDYFSKAKTKECNQGDCNFYDKFGITTHCSATFYLEVGAPVSMKAATKASLRGKKPLKT